MGKINKVNKITYSFTISNHYDHITQKKVKKSSFEMNKAIMYIENEFGSFMTEYIYLNTDFLKS